MRISNAMVANNIQSYLARQTEQLLKTQEKISTGKRINRPSDDPIGMGRALSYRAAISSLEQYNDNITDAKLHIDTVDSILETITGLLKEAKTISADPHPDMRSMLADQVGTLREQLLQMANSKRNGSYVFAGNLTDTPPYDNNGSYSGDDGTKDYLIGDGSLQIGIEADGRVLFGQSPSIFDNLTDLQNALMAEDATGITDQLAPLSDAIETINTVRAVNAGQYKRLDATESHYKSFKLNMQDLLSSTEEADMAATIIEWQVQQTAYESTLSTAAKILPPSLIDFMK